MPEGRRKSRTRLNNMQNKKEDNKTVAVSLAGLRMPSRTKCAEAMFIGSLAELMLHPLAGAQVANGQAACPGKTLLDQEYPAATRGEDNAPSSTGLARRVKPKISFWIVTTLAVIALTGAFAPALPSDEPETEYTLTQARELATSGHRVEALRLLEERLAQSPDDSDSRVLYGIVLSWEGRYDESREQLRRVLAKSPNYGDALLALINVELWSDHPDRAEQIAREAIQHTPDNPNLLLAHTRALIALNRNSEAVMTLDRLLALEPRNQQALQMRRRIQETSRQWEVSVDYDYEWFSRAVQPQNEVMLNLKRRTPLGSLIGRYSHANRFSSTSNQLEVDFYPRIRPGTYAYLNVGYSPDANLYPRYRFGTDVYQSLKGGFEVSMGYRRLGFGNGVNIYTPSLGNYHGNWYFLVRGFLTPNTFLTPSGGSTRISRTAIFSARRYFGETGLHDFVGIRFGRGAGLAQARTLQDVEVLNSTSVAAEIDKSFARRWSVSFTGGASLEDRSPVLRHIWHYQADGTLYFRF